MMRVALLAFLLHSACADSDPVSPDTVITALTFLPADGAIADGVSRATVTLTTQSEGRDPKLTALLHLSDGTWVDKADSGDAHALTVTMAAASEQRDMIQPSSTNPISVTATIDGIVQTKDLALVGTPITKIDATATGVLPPASATSGTAVALSALLETPRGKPSVGTYVDFSVQVTPTGKGYPAAQTLVVADSPTVTTTYNVLPGAETLSIVVTARPYGQPPCLATTTLP